MWWPLCPSASGSTTRAAALGAFSHSPLRTCLPTAWSLSIGANNNVLTTPLPVNETGGFIVFLDTSSASDGYYVVTAGANPGAATAFLLDTQAPLRPQEG